MATTSIPTVAQTTAEQAADAYRTTYADYGDIVRYLERLASDACMPLGLMKLYVEDHPTSASALEAVEAAREVRDFLRHLFERMYELRRSRALPAFDAVWQAAEAAEQEGQR